MKNFLKLKLKPGFTPILLIGIVAILFIVVAIVFGPGELVKFGQLGLRQQEQQASAAVVPAIPPGDSDSDGFSDDVEKWIKTDPSDNCADDPKDAAWPVDFNNDKVVDQADLDMIKAHFGKSVMSAENRRYDLNADKRINITDTFLFSNFFNKGCPYHFMSDTRHEGPNMLFMWAPATEAPVLFSIIDLTKSGQLDCSLAQSYQSSAFTTTIGVGQRTFGWSRGEAGHEYCAALLRWENNSYRNLLSNFVRFTIPASLSVTPQSVDVTIKAGQIVKVLDLKSNSANGFQFYGYPTSFGPGINWYPQSGGIVPGQTIPISIQVIERISAGTYTGVGILNDIQGATRINIPVKVNVLNPTVIPQAPSEVSARARSCTTTGTVLVQITWRDNSENERGFRIEVRDASALVSNFNQVGEVQGATGTGSTIEYYWNQAKPGIRYIFRVGAYNETGINYGYFDNYVVPTGCPQPIPSPQ